MLNGVSQKLCMALLAALLATAAPANDEVLRIQKDSAGGREWLLTPRGVLRLEKDRTNPVLVELRAWIWADEAYVCPPDLALGPKGEAVVSSNVVPTLWRIDPLSLRVTRHELVLDAHVD